MALAPVVVCLSRTGEETARKIAEMLDCGIHGLAKRTESADVTFDNAADHLQSLFVAGTPIIGVCATGILVRVLSPFLASKSTEPPVLAVAEDGSAVIPLLGGHRGANRIARHLAENLGCHAAVTTAGDVSLGVALDEPPPGWRLANPEHAGAAMADLLAGAGTRVEGENVFGLESRPDGRISWSQPNRRSRRTRGNWSTTPSGSRSGLDVHVVAKPENWRHSLMPFWRVPGSRRARLPVSRRWTSRRTSPRYSNWRIRSMSHWHCFPPWNWRRNPIVSPIRQRSCSGRSGVTGWPKPRHLP